MAAFPWATKRVLPVSRAIVFGVVMTAVHVGFVLPTAMAGRGGGGHASFHRGGHVAPRPALNYYSPKKYAPKTPAPTKPAHKKYVPPKHVPQKRVAQKHESQKHTPQQHLGRTNTSRKPQARQYGPRKNLAKRSTSPKHVATTSKYRRPHSVLKTAKKRTLGNLHSHAPHHAYRYHPRRQYPGWHYFHRRHHHWRHPWWLYDDYYDDYWYATNAYYDYAELQRQTAINSVRAQIAAAEEVLQSAVSRQEMLEEDLQAAQQRIAKARAAIQNAIAEQVDGNKTMREIEARLIAAQGSDSDVVQAQAKMDAMRATLDREVHRVLSLPPHSGTPTSADYAHEIAMLSFAQKEKLDKDDQFLAATGNLKAAMQGAASVRQALFEKDPGWVAARDKAVKAKQLQTQADRDLGKVTGVGQLSPKLQLHGAQDLAAQARAVIAAGRAVLRSLGASAPATKDEPPSSSST